MDKYIGVPRYLVEEELTRGSLELKKEVVETDGRTHCYYGHSLDEEGEWELVYAKNGELESYRKLEEVLRANVNRKVLKAINDLVVVGMSKDQTDENLLKGIRHKPAGQLETVEDIMFQKYGFQNGSKLVVDLKVYYDKNLNVLKKELIPYEDFPLN